MAWLGPALSIVGSLIGGGGGGQSAAENNQNQINQWLIPLLQKQARQGMDPRVLMAAQSGNDAEFLRQMNSASAAQGPGYRGMADMPYDQAINDAMFNSQIAGQQQGIEDQAKRELAGISAGYGQQATQLPQNNPFMNIAGALSGGGGDALGSLFSRMFGGGGSGGGANIFPSLGQFMQTSAPVFTPPPMSQNTGGVPGYYSGTVSSSPLANGPHQ